MDPQNSGPQLYRLNMLEPMDPRSACVLKRLAWSAKRRLSNASPATVLSWGQCAMTCCVGIRGSNQVGSLKLLQFPQRPPFRPCGWRHAGWRRFMRRVHKTQWEAWRGFTIHVWAWWIKSLWSLSILEVGSRSTLPSLVARLYLDSVRCTGRPCLTGVWEWPRLWPSEQLSWSSTSRWSG